MLDKITRYLSRQYVRRRLAEMVAPGYPILLDYPLRCSHRYGYGKPPHQQLFAIFQMHLLSTIGSWWRFVCLVLRVPLGRIHV